MPAHHFLRRHARMRGHIGQIGAELAAVAHGNFHQLAGGVARFARRPRHLQITLQRGHVGGVVEDHGEVVHAGHHVHHAAPVGSALGHGPDAALDIERSGRRHAIEQRLLGQAMDGAIGHVGQPVRMGRMVSDRM
ncbi:hypothetical protein D3C81_1404840 [compost metagenome]